MKTTELQLAPTETTAVARPHGAPSALVPSFNIEDVFRYAIEHQGTAETLEKLMAIRRELNAEQAKKAFDDALSAFQSECPVILKEKMGAVVKSTGKAAYRFAPIEAIEIQIRPLLRKYGFSHTFDMDTASAEGCVIARCIVTHVGGHSRPSSAKFPLGTKTDVMSVTQVYAAALTFAQRRALMQAYGLVVAGEDIDGATGRVKPAGPSSLAPDKAVLKSLAGDLWAILKPVRGGAQNWQEANVWLTGNDIIGNTEEAPNFSADKFREVIAKSKIALGVA